jgi:hypothetical protein
MRIPFTRVSTITEAQRLLMDRGAVIAPPGRAPAGVVDHPAGRPGHDRRPRGDRDKENFNPDGSRKDRHERKPRFKVELLCRTFAGDAGLRPLPNMVFWESPDIVIEGPSGDPDVATPGVVNKVKVHVWNLGLADCWASHVDLYWCNPSVGINPAVANPIGSKVVPLAAGQHSVVSFDWTPILVNAGHECLVAQVYDPVSDPVVAPFNPVQDRHVGQRNISVVQVAANQVVNFDVFSQNLGLTQANTLIEVQKLEGEALEILALSMGRDVWPLAGGTEVELSRPAVIQVPTHPHARDLMTGTFRETLQEVPGPSESRRVMGVMRTLVAPQKGQIGKEEMPAPQATTAQEYEAKAPDSSEDLEVGEPTGEPGGTLVRLPPGRHVRMSLRTVLPPTAERGSADVWRIVEHTAGRITGGVTIIVQAR